VKKIFSLLLIAILIFIIIGCGNRHNADRIVAEEYALDRVISTTFHFNHTVERSVYDEETGEFIVYISSDGETDLERFVVRVENGRGVYLWWDRGIEHEVIATEHAINFLNIRGFVNHTIQEIFYDEETGKYVVYALLEDENDVKRVEMRINRGRVVWSNINTILTVNYD